MRGRRAAWEKGRVGEGLRERRVAWERTAALHALCRWLLRWVAAVLFAVLHRHTVWAG